MSRTASITVYDPRLSSDTNADLRAMYDAFMYSRRRSPMGRNAYNQVRASLGMDCDTLNGFFALCDGVAS